MNIIKLRKRAAYSKSKTAFGICMVQCCNKVQQMTTKHLPSCLKKCLIQLYLGGMYLPKSDSGRIIVGTWWLVVLVVVTTYCGNLVAFLTFPKMEIPVNTVGQLVNQRHDFTWSIPSNTYLESYLKVRTKEK